MTRLVSHCLTLLLPIFGGPRLSGTIIHRRLGAVVLTDSAGHQTVNGLIGTWTSHAAVRMRRDQPEAELKLRASCV
jgi:hypothetical protein